VKRFHGRIGPRCQSGIPGSGEEGKGGDRPSVTQDSGRTGRRRRPTPDDQALAVMCFLGNHEDLGRLQGLIEALCSWQRGRTMEMVIPRVPNRASPPPTHRRNDACGAGPDPLRKCLPGSGQAMVLSQTFTNVHFALISVGVLILLWLGRGFTVRVSGTWDRVDEGLRSGDAERITLIQFGPFVRGRRLVDGGFQEFNGILNGRTMSLTRRDHGEELIVRQGFPKELADQIDGTVTARLRLTLSADGLAIFGEFTPQKIEFTYRPPQITGRHYLDPSYRRYRLATRELPGDHDVQPFPSPGGQTSKRLRKTF
jgi:hypothetical protein